MNNLGKEKITFKLASAVRKQEEMIILYWKNEYEVGVK